jgi:hypothetical protein
MTDLKTHFHENSERMGTQLELVLDPKRQNPN